MYLHNDRVSLEWEVHQGNNHESTQISIYFMFRYNNNFLMIVCDFSIVSHASILARANSLYVS